jgi:threonine/homoserine/homoserine lactone efflux protein
VETLATAFVLGLTAGISPGPLLTLVLSSTLERGFGAGARVSLAPVLTDGPIVLAALFVLKDLDPRWLAAITLLGGLFVVWIGIQTVRSARQELELEARDGGGVRDLARGAIVNLLNPHPWLFWMSVGGPLLIDAWRQSPGLAVAFLVVFYGLIVGSKVLLAWITARGRRSITGIWYKRALVGSGVLLMALGMLLAWRGVGALLA